MSLDVLPNSLRIWLRAVGLETAGLSFIAWPALRRNQNGACPSVQANPYLDCLANLKGTPGIPMLLPVNKWGKTLFEYQCRPHSLLYTVVSIPGQNGRLQRQSAIAYSLTSCVCVCVCIQAHVHTQVLMCQVNTSSVEMCM